MSNDDIDLRTWLPTATTVVVNPTAQQGIVPAQVVTTGQAAADQQPGGGGDALGAFAEPAPEPPIVRRPLLTLPLMWCSCCVLRCRVRRVLTPVPRASCVGRSRRVRDWCGGMAGCKASLGHPPIDAVLVLCASMSRAACADAGAVCVLCRALSPGA
jgi:hypothetical protein